MGEEQESELTFNAIVKASEDNDTDEPTDEQIFHAGLELAELEPDDKRWCALIAVLIQSDTMSKAFVKESTYQKLLMRVDLDKFVMNPHRYTVGLKYLADCIDSDRCMTFEEYQEWVCENDRPIARKGLDS